MKSTLLVICLLITCNIFPQKPCPDFPKINFEGKTYNTVQIGAQCWFKENLDVGTMILSQQNQSNNGKIEKYCYLNDPNNCKKYGGLYLWDEAMQYVLTERTQGICPPGWHIPSKADIKILGDEVNNGNNGCNAIKAIGEGKANGAGTNTTGFSAILCGNYYYGSFSGINKLTHIWTSTVVNNERANFIKIYDYAEDVRTGSDKKSSASSIRCLKD